MKKKVVTMVVETTLNDRLLKNYFLRWINHAGCEVQVAIKQMRIFLVATKK